MPKKKQERLEFRYYEMPRDSYVLPLLGESWVREYGRDVDFLHFHNFMEVGFCYGGEGSLILKQEECPYFSDMFSIIPPNYPHNTRSRPGEMSRWEYLFLDIEGFLRYFYPERPRLAEEMVRRMYRKAYFLTYEANPALGNTIQEIIREMRYRGAYYKERVKGLLLSFIVETLRLSKGESDAEGSRGQDEQSRIGDALHYIGEHYSENIRIETLARECSLSETHFRRVFKSVMNMSPMEYVNLVRIQTACSMLERSGDSIEEIAMKTGFISMSTFNRNFKKRMNMTPHKWRTRPESYQRNPHRFHVSVEEGWK